MHCRSKIDVEQLLNYLRKDYNYEILDDELLIENVMGNDKDDEATEDSTTRKESLQIIMTFEYFLFAIGHDGQNFLVCCEKLEMKYMARTNIRENMQS